ncbi:MAG: DUF1707 domain-containing protein [Mycolicibacterium sp.]|uniref:DUF1707 domain-containing protein n=1 Tax=Mycolicibacterium sp. TaxID=2320850 RepID=UPI000FA868F8|nr:DUF1707 domain-containing protein [Mycolicibacterium sp.]RUP33273.1 MAG: DUF1707 domain-containing protein [Mycolicibacterium sp.]
MDRHENLPFPEPPHHSAASRTPDTHIRVGDADRQTVSHRLSRAVAEGRLTLTEYDTRLQRLYRAETRGELADIVSDLPRSDERGELKPQRKQSIPAWVVIMWMPWVAVNLLCLAIWLATGAGYFWPFWVAVPWGCALLIPSAIGVFTSGGRVYVRGERPAAPCGHHDSRPAHRCHGHRDRGVPIIAANAGHAGRAVRAG